MRVIDSVYVDVSVSVKKGFSEERVMLLDVGSVGRAKVFQLVTGFQDGQDLFHPVNSGVHDSKPEKLEHNIFSATAHDIEEVLLGDLFNVFVEGVLCFTPILFFLGLISSFLAITHPLHIISPLTPLVFIIASFHLLLQTPLTHSHLLICTSSQFHCIPSVSICLVIVPDYPKSQVYKPSTCLMSP